MRSGFFAKGLSIAECTGFGKNNSSTDYKFPPMRATGASVLSATRTTQESVTLFLVLLIDFRVLVRNMPEGVEYQSQSKPPNVNSSKGLVLIIIK